MKVIVAAVLLALVLSKNIVNRLKKKHHKKKAIYIQRFDEVPCPSLYFLKYNEDDDLDHRRLVNETCTHCTIYQGCPEGQACLRGLRMDIGDSINSGVCMRLQDVYDHLSEIESNSLNLRTLIEEPELVGEVSSRTFRSRFSRTQRTTIIKRVMTSEISKERKQRMILSVGGRDALPPVAAEFVMDAIPKEDTNWQDQIKNIIDNGSPYYINEFQPIEEMKPVGLDGAGIPPLKRDEIYVEPPLMKYTGARVIQKKQMFIMPDVKNDEGREIKFGKPLILSAENDKVPQEQDATKLPQKTAEMLNKIKCSIPPGCDEEGNPIDPEKAVEQAEAKQLKKTNKRIKKKHHHKN